jgi:dTDP-4-dehydrorhamnose 3,5-epimerase
MPYIKTDFEGLWVFEPVVFGDIRGYFFESFNKKTLADETGLNMDFVQDNESKSTKGVLRGLHFQLNPMAQAKLVRVTQGAVQDVVVDLRQNSPTFGKYFSIVLSDENKKQLLIPRGFAHGFLTLSDEAVFNYKCDNYYSKEHDSGILWNDKAIGIEWQMASDSLILSEKDINLPTLKDSLAKF